ncbi:MAG: peptide deformylase [Endozoicomonas sp.]
MRWILCILLVVTAAGISAAPVPEKNTALQGKNGPAQQPEKKEAAKGRPVIYQFDNPEHQLLLNAPTQPIKQLPDKALDDFIKTMHSAMTSNIGGGISANQLGKPWQVFLIGPPPMVTASAPSEVFINPVITKASKERVCFWHGCLSSKGKEFGRVATWKSITMSAMDAKGKTFTRDLIGLDAIVAQHEFRHLLGGGYHDHAKEFQQEKELFLLMLQKKIRMIELCDEKEPFLLDDYRVGEKIEDYARRKEHAKTGKPDKKKSQKPGKKELKEKAPDKASGASAKD